QRNDAERGHREQRIAGARDRREQRRHEQDDERGERADHEDDAVAHVQPIAANQVDDPQQQPGADRHRHDDAGARHDTRFRIMLACTMLSTTISSVFSGYLMWLSVEYIDWPCRRSATVIGNSPTRYPRRIR